MPTPAQVRMGAAVLARMGMDATLDGLPAGKVHVNQRARVQEGQAVYERVVATIVKTAAPAMGQVLVHPDGTWTLDSLLSDNGVNQRWVLR